MDKVIVMLSTYNGSMYLNRQIDSILAQEGVAVELYIRDDGSTDDTISILEEYIKLHNNIHLCKGNNVGYIKSFMWLVMNVPVDDHCYYSFSDQDDIWDSSKLYNAVTMIKKQDEETLPIMYYSDLKVVDESENFIRHANTWEGSIDKYKLSVFIGIRGCTMVYNANLQKELIQYKPHDISGHDTYIALVAFWLGKVVYDSGAYINYRQTGNNLSITGVSKLDKFKKNLLYVKKRLTVRANIHEKNAREVCNGYGNKIPDVEKLREVAEYRKSLKNKFRLLFDKDYKKFSLQIRLFNLIFILLGKL